MELLRNDYRVTGGVVSWNGRPVPRADASSFVHLGGAWARDARTVFVQNSAKAGIDLATFEYLNPVFVKDAHGVYDWEGRIKGADPSSFAVLDPGIHVDDTITTRVWARGYARDSKAVYYHDQMFGRASALRVADPPSFASLRNDHGLDAKNVWFQKTRLPGADPKTWIYLGRLWSMDVERTYYAGRLVDGVDRSKFTVVNAPTIGNFATDGSRFFDADREIEPAEFRRRLGDNFGQFEKWFDVALRNIATSERA